MASKSIGERVDAEMRQLLSMRQHKAGLTEGTLTLEALEERALRRVLAARGVAAEEEIARAAAREWNVLSIDAGQPLMQSCEGVGLPFLVFDDETVPAVTDATLPARAYDVRLARRIPGGPATAIVIDLDYTLL